MAIFTYSEYAQAQLVLLQAQQGAVAAADVQHTACREHAAEQNDQTVAMLATVHPTTQAEAEELRLAYAAAADLLERQQTECDQIRQARVQEAHEAYSAAMAQLNADAEAGEARMARLIITAEDLLPAAAAAQHVSWYDNQTPATAHIRTVRTPDELRAEFGGDRWMFELLLLLRFEDGQVVLDGDRIRIADVVDTVPGTTILRVQETTHVRGELDGAAPTDLESLRAFGTWNVLASWNVVVPPCAVSDVRPADATVLTHAELQFTASGTNLGNVTWSTSPAGSPARGSGPTFTTTWTSPGPKQVTASCGSTTLGVATTVVRPQVELTVPDADTRLMNEQVLTASVVPADAPVTAYTFQIKRRSTSTWATLASGPAPATPFTARVAGRFELRVRAEINGKPETSPVVELTVGFPRFTDVVADDDVRLMVDASWLNTLAAATPTSRREEGFWIRLDTATGRYTHTTLKLGRLVGPKDYADIVLGRRPADVPPRPRPTGTAVYTVASFHTHTPTAFRPVGRPTGPSPADNAFDGVRNVTGLVYDYIDTPFGSFEIPKEHPLESSAKVYQSGPISRSLPL